MEPTNVVPSVVTTSSVRRLCRQFKYLLEYRKPAILGLILLLALTGRYLHHVSGTRKSSDDKRSFQSSLQRAGLRDERISNPSLVQLMMERDRIFRERKERAENVCKELTPLSPLYKPRNGTLYFDILWEPHYQMAYCPTPRTGLTVWNRYFAGLAHLPYWPQWLPKLWLLVRNIYNLPHGLSHEEMQQLVNSSLTFTFVRHPFDRLVAVYNDRVVASNFNGWQKEIKKRLDKKEEDEVSFLEFVEFVLNNEAGDSEHLDTSYHHCDMCRIRYDLIGKFESFADDTRYILIRTGAHEVIDIYDDSLSWFTNRPHSVTTKEAALPYFKQLPKETILRLYLRYEMDFKMFDYSADEYYAQGIN